jgi:hypothetical protein
MKFPSIESIASLIRELKPTILDEYRAYENDESDEPSMLLTVGCDTETGWWGWQTGDNSFTGGAYGFPIWGCAAITRRCNSREFAREIIAELAG